MYMYMYKARVVHSHRHDSNMEYEVLDKFKLTRIMKPPEVSSSVTKVQVASRRR